jgi:hypothetical protein
MIEEVPQQFTQSALDVPCAASSELQNSSDIGSGLILQHKLSEQKDTYDAHQIDSGYLDPSDIEETEEEEDELSEIENEHIQRVFVPRETEHKLKRRRNLLVTKLHHLRKDLNILVIGPDNAGKTSLINSLGYMINQDDKGNLKWRNFADYDLGRTFKYKAARVWPLEKQKVRNSPQVAPKKNLTFYEASGLQKCGDVEKSSTILQYFLEGRITPGLLTLFLLMTTDDITARYCDLSTDPRVLESRRVHAIVHCTAADQPPNNDLIKLVQAAMAKSKDPRVKKMPILTCVTSPHGEVKQVPVYETSSYDMSAQVRSNSVSGPSSGMRRNSSTGRLTGGHKSSFSQNLCEPRVCREVTYYAPDYNPVTDESETDNIQPDNDINNGLLRLFDDILRVSQRDNTKGRGRRLVNMIVELFN